jgi:vancomycin resistance protein YoaR
MHIPLNEQKIKTAVKKVHHYSKATFWFSVGFSIAGLTIISIIAIIFQNLYKNKTIPGVYIDNTNVSEKTQAQIENLFDQKNKEIENSTFTFTYQNEIATVSAKKLNIGYNSKLIALQAISLGKASNVFSNFFNITNAYLNGITLNSSFTFNENILSSILIPLENKAYVKPIDAQFKVENNRVTAFKQSLDGKKLNTIKAKEFIEGRVSQIATSGRYQSFTYEIPDMILKPQITTEAANSFGIVEEIGEGHSLFHHSIPNRIYNVALASSRVNGILVKPGEEFSFDKYLGDVTKYTGYAQAYIISGGKTILGDGGGVCQVSTTLFRAILDAGLPVTARTAHAYRVGYYEEDGPPGIDATVFYPSVDLKFINDTGNYILIQSYIDQDAQSLKYVLYGKKDGREVEMTTPVISGYVPSPDALYQDDPTLPKGVTNQVDFAAAGATVVFNRTVKKDGQVIISEKYISRYAPWRAVFMVGTKG